MTELTRDTLLPAWLPGATHALLRVFTGALFMQHGVQKLFGLLLSPERTWSGPPEMLSQMWFAGVMEVFGGAGLWPILNGGESPILFGFIFLYLFATGAGRFSLDAALRGRRRTTAA